MPHHASFRPSHRHLLSQINPFTIDFKTGKDNKCHSDAPNKVTEPESMR